MLGLAEASEAKGDDSNVFACLDALVFYVGLTRLFDNDDAIGDHLLALSLHDYACLGLHILIILIWQHVLIELMHPAQSQAEQPIHEQSPQSLRI